MPGVSKIDANPKIRAKAVRLRAEGKSLTETGIALGVNRNTVWHWTQRKDIQEAIQQQAAELLATVPRAVDTYRRTLEDAAAVEVVPHLVEYEIDDLDRPGETKKVMVPADSKAIANNIKLLSVAREASRDILQTAGILAAQAEARTIVNIFGADAVEALSPAIGQLMGMMTQAGAEPEAIDITPEEDD